jgi:spoIIIJ-associated protein
MTKREQRSEIAKQWLEKLLQLMGVPAEVQIGEETSVQAEASCWLVIDQSQLAPEQIEQLIGPAGEGIDAIQYLANTILNIGEDAEEQQSYTVELDGYRLKRQAELFAWANQVAEQVRQTGQEVEMKALSSAERRQIHTFFQEETDLETESRGQEPDRRLVIRLR